MKNFLLVHCCIYFNANFSPGWFKKRSTAGEHTHTREAPSCWEAEKSVYCRSILQLLEKWHDLCWRALSVGCLRRTHCPSFPLVRKSSLPNSSPASHTLTPSGVALADLLEQPQQPPPAYLTTQTCCGGTAFLDTHRHLWRDSWPTHQQSISHSR